MRLTRAFMIVGGGTALLAAPALAQGRPLPVQKPPTHAQTGTAGQTPPPAASRADRGRGERRERDGAYARRSSGYAYVPAMIGKDGFVYGNFGYGYERVTRQCSLFQTTQPSPAGPSTPPQPYSQPQLTQPVPRPQTAAPANGTGSTGLTPAHASPPSTVGQTSGYSGLTTANSMPMHAGPPTQLAAAGCWSRLANGNVAVQR
jgi:hypothetical protein